MSAPFLPNLLSLRGASRGGRGRARGRGGHSSASHQDHDAIIQATDTDAAVSRLSAVDVGLLDDPFARFFAQVGAGLVARRLPIINRGTYTRTTGLDILITSFLSGASATAPATSAERQIISLGAGTDTRSLRLLAQSRFENVIYHEIDFPVICTRKLNTAKATPVLRRILPDPSVEEHGSWHVRAQGGNQFWCHGRDLRELPRADPAVLPGLKRDVPTLLISECCLCYLEADEAKAVTKWFTDLIPSIGIAIYEPVNPNDAFGKTMVSNLGARGIVMPSLAAYPTPSSQEARLRDAGFEHTKHMTIDQMWERWVAEGEKERVSGLEGLDEVEEWKLLSSHYIVTWGWRGSGFGTWSDL